MANINPVLEAARASNKAVTSARTDIQNNVDEAANIAAEQAAINTSIGANAVIADQAKQNSALAIQEAILASGVAFGTNIQEREARITQIIAEQDRAANERSEALKAVNAKKAVGFFDNPIEYIINQFTINDDIDKYNAANRMFEDSVQRIDVLNRMAQQTATTQQLYKKEVTAGTIAASAENISNQAKLAANEAKLKGLANNMQGIMAVTNMTLQQLDVASRVFSAEAQQQNLANDLMRIKMQKDEFDARMKDRQAAIDESKQSIDFINRGMIKLYGPGAEQFTADSPKSSLIIKMMNSGSIEGQRFRDAFHAGWSNVNSPTPGETARIISQSGMYFPESNRQTIGNLFERVRASITDPAVLKDPKLYQAAAEQETNKLITGYIKEVKPGDIRNPFNIGDVRTILDNTPALKELPVVQKLIWPRVEKDIVTRPGDFVPILANGIRDGVITSAEATQFTKIIQAGVMLNSARQNFANYGITIKNQVDNTGKKITNYTLNDYRTEVPLDGIGMSSAVYNLNDGVELNRAISTYLLRTTGQSTTIRDIMK